MSVVSPVYILPFCKDINNHIHSFLIHPMSEARTDNTERLSNMLYAMLLFKIKWYDDDGESQTRKEKFILTRMVDILDYFEMGIINERELLTCTKNCRARALRWLFRKPYINDIKERNDSNFFHNEMQSLV